MKKIVYLLFLSLLIISCRSGKVNKDIPKISKEDKNKIPQCVDLTFDLNDGTISGVKPILKQSEIREWFPCHTKFVADGSNADCGGALYYDNHGFTFYTYLYEYVEVKRDFKGKVTHDIFSKNRQEIRQLLGQPAQNDLSSQYPEMDFFSMEFGCIRIKYENDIPVSISAHHLACDEIDWCR